MGASFIQNGAFHNAIAVRDLPPPLCYRQRPHSLIAVPLRPGFDWNSMRASCWRPAPLQIGPALGQHLPTCQQRTVSSRRRKRRPSDGLVWRWCRNKEGVQRHSLDFWALYRELRVNRVKDKSESRHERKTFRPSGARLVRR
jgi:hypothetical protein